jgi:hypothetical protein
VVVIKCFRKGGIWGDLGVFFAVICCQAFKAGAWGGRKEKYQG